MFDVTASLPTAEPRDLGRLVMNQTCKLYGWGGAEDFPRNDAVTVNGQSSCGMETYCTTLSPNADTCAAKLGSPIVCNDGFIDGFVIKNSGCSDRFLISYHSVDDFREWIDSVSGAEKTFMPAIIFILASTWLSVKIFS